MESTESQMMTLIHKVDTLYEMMEQLNHKIALISAQYAYTSKKSAKPCDFDVRISDYSMTGEIVGDRLEYLDLNNSDKILPNGQNHQNHHYGDSASNTKVLEATLNENKLDLSSPMDMSSPYLEEEDCYPSGEVMEPSLIHKDVLGNEDYREEMVECNPPEMTEAIQIRRLTAQLTAAYNRIAALEEQLISKRIHF